MSLWKIAWRSIQQRSLASTLTAVSMALGVALVVAVLVMATVVQESFKTGSALGYNMIVGAKGGKLQLVLNTVYYLSQPVENIPYWYYKEFLPKEKRSDGKDGKFSDVVDVAVPVCLGDYFSGYRVIGTTPAMFDAFEYGDNKKYTFSAGGNFKTEEPLTAVIGDEVARKTGLTLGGDVQPEHGVPGGHKHDPFKVVGILAHTGTPNDRGVFINIEGFYMQEHHAAPKEFQRANPDEAPGHEHPADHHDADHHDADHHDEHAAAPAAAKPASAHMADAHHEEAHHDDAHHHDDGDDDDHDHDEHEHHHHAPLPENEREVTAVLLRTKSAPGVPDSITADSLQKPIDKGEVAQIVSPIREITNFFGVFVMPLKMVLVVLTVLIVIVSGIGIMVSIYNSMSDRRHEIAVMRALGARRDTVMLIVLFESILLSLGGGVLGWLLGHGLIAALSPWMLNETGVALGFFKFAPLYELILIPGLVLLASLVGYLPAMTAYRTDVSRSLTAAQ